MRRMRWVRLARLGIYPDQARTIGRDDEAGDEALLELK